LIEEKEKKMLKIIVLCLISFAVAVVAALNFHRKRGRAFAGTAPANFPPENVVPVGGVITGNKLGLTAALGSTVFFTAPTAGLYLIAAYMQITATNNAGTITTTVLTPAAGNITEPTQDGVSKIVAVLKDAAPATPTDGFMAGVPLWMNAGQTINASTAVSGLTGTTYNIFVSALRLF
jgi:hypothetical protein